MFIDAGLPDAISFDREVPRVFDDEVSPPPGVPFFPVGRSLQAAPSIFFLKPHPSASQRWTVPSRFVVFSWR